jgi:Domain of unknown function (DUF397)
MFHDGVAARSLSWRKATRSIGNGDCVEVAPDDGQVAIRDSKDPAGPVIHYSASTWQSFLHKAKRGNFDRHS